MSNLAFALDDNFQALLGYLVTAGTEQRKLHALLNEWLGSLQTRMDRRALVLQVAEIAFDTEDMIALNLALNCGAEPNATVQSNWRPCPNCGIGMDHNRPAYSPALNNALDNGRFELAAMLLNRADIDVNDRDHRRRIALDLAIQRGAPSELVGKLLELSDRRVINSPTIDSSPLQSAMRKQRVDLMQLLHRSGKVDINQKFDGVSPLLLAIESSNPEIMETLLSFPELDLDREIRWGQPLSLYLAAEKRFDLIRRLSADARFNILATTPLGCNILTLAHQDLSLRQIRWLCGKWPKLAEQADDQGFYPLHRVTSSGRPNLIGYLGNLPGVNPNSRSKGGTTPLLLAIEQFAATSSIGALLKIKRIDPNLPSRAGDPPIHSAIKKGHFGAVRMLANCERVDLRKRNRAGLTPLKLAKRHESFHAAEVISKALRDREEIRRKRVRK